MKSSTGSKRDKYLRKTYGITEKQYRTLLKAQGGRCAICRRKPPKGKSLSVDHRHFGDYHVRGLACFHCNRFIIGRNRDSRLLLRAAAYLDRPPADEVIYK